SIADDRIEFGMGIHGEPGIWRGPMKSADALAQEMLDHLLSELDIGRGSRVAVLVNSLGATPHEELYILYRHVAKVLAARGATPAKCALNVREVLAADAAGIGATLQRCAQACAKASGSSFGTLLAIAFLSAAKTAGERERLDRDALVELLRTVQQALAARGGGSLGDKTLLDSLHAVADALHGA